MSQYAAGFRGVALHAREAARSREAPGRQIPLISPCGRVQPRGLRSQTRVVLMDWKTAAASACRPNLTSPTLPIYALEAQDRPVVPRVEKASIAAS